MSETATLWKGARRRADRNYGRKREAILQVAARLFRDRGYENTSVNELADELGVTKPTIYYYFENKDDILLVIMSIAQERIIETLREVSTSPGSGIERLQEAMYRYSLILMSDFGQCLAIISNDTLLPQSRAEVEGRIRTADELIFAIMDQAVAEGAIRFPDRRLAYHAIFGALNSTAFWYKPTGRLAAEQIARDMAQMLLDGLRPR